MDLVQGKCSVCGNTKILKGPDADSEETKLQITNAFYKNDKAKIQQVETLQMLSLKYYSVNPCLQLELHGSSIHLCMYCTVKVQISSSFLKQYDSVKNRKAVAKDNLRKCFICETKSKLIKTDADPDGFRARMKVFMQSSQSPKEFAKCAVCLTCLFQFDIWCTMKQCIQDMVNIKYIIVAL